MIASARLLVLATVFIAPITSAATFNPAALNTVTIVNRTDEVLKYVFASPGDSNYWGADILGASHTVTSGGSYKFNLLYPNASNEFDILAMDTDDNRYELRGVVVTDGEEKTIVIDDSDMSRTAAMTFTRINVKNVTGYDIYYLFFSSNDSTMWGADILGLSNATVIEDGETFSFLVPSTTDKVKYNVRAVDSDNDTYTFDVTFDDSEESYLLEVELSDLDD